MSKLKVSQRLRGHMKRLFAEYGHGSKANLARYSQQSPAGSRLHPQDISDFINETPGRTPIDLDNLDDIASFFRCSIGELLGETKLGDLSGDEQRMVYAFRALPHAFRDHFLGILELAALAPRTDRESRLSTSTVRATKTPPKAVDGRPIPAPHDSTDPAEALASLRGFITRLVLELADAAAGSIPDRPIPGTRVDEADSG